VNAASPIKAEIFDQIQKYIQEQYLHLQRNFLPSATPCYQSLESPNLVSHLIQIRISEGKASFT
jgi:hypothetical protein